MRRITRLCTLVGDSQDGSGGFTLISTFRFPKKKVTKLAAVRRPIASYGGLGCLSPQVQNCQVAIGLDVSVTLIEI